MFKKLTEVRCRADWLFSELMTEICFYFPIKDVLMTSEICLPSWKVHESGGESLVEGGKLK